MLKLLGLVLELLVGLLLGCWWGEWVARWWKIWWSYVDVVVVVIGWLLMLRIQLMLEL